EAEILLGRPLARRHLLRVRTLDAELFVEGVLPRRHPEGIGPCRSLTDRFSPAATERRQSRGLAQGVRYFRPCDQYPFARVSLWRTGPRHGDQWRNKTPALIRERVSCCSSPHISDADSQKRAAIGLPFSAMARGRPRLSRI